MSRPLASEAAATIDQDGWSTHGRPMPGCWDPWPGKVKASIRGQTDGWRRPFHDHGKFRPGNAMPGRELGACPGWDSNPHRAEFETAASANWATGATRGP